VEETGESQAYCLSCRQLPTNLHAIQCQIRQVGLPLHSSSGYFHSYTSLYNESVHSYTVSSIFILVEKHLELSFVMQCLESIN
jgi:hypothetical protein